LFPTILCAIFNYQLFQHDFEKIRNLKPANILELFVLNYKYVKPIWRELPKIFAIQMVIATACVYTSIWARGRQVVVERWEDCFKKFTTLRRLFTQIFRIFDSFDMDPETVRSAVNAAPKDTWQARIMDKIQRLNIQGTSNDPTILTKSSTDSLESIRSRFQTTSEKDQQ
jgi:hypothetical protein